MYLYIVIYYLFLYLFYTLIFYFPLLLTGTDIARSSCFDNGLAQSARDALCASSEYLMQASAEYLSKPATDPLNRYSSDLHNRVSVDPLSRCSTDPLSRCSSAHLNYSSPDHLHRGNALQRSSAACELLLRQSPVITRPDSVCTLASSLDPEDFMLDFDITEDAGSSTGPE